MKKRVMIVDDAAVMRTIINNLLAPDPNMAIMGFATNGKEALEKLAQVQPDLILLDIEMPEMDGLEFLRHARLRTKAKIVVLSSVAEGPRATQAKLLGADAVMMKPSGAVSYDLKEKKGAEILRTLYSLLNIQPQVH